MKKIQEIIEKEAPLEYTLNLKDLFGIRVISKRGKVVGNVSQFRINANSMEIEGILVSRGIFKKPFYVGKSYLKQISKDAIILNIEPTNLLKGIKVVTSDGKILGKVKEVIRKGDTNIVEGIVVSSLFKKKKTIRASSIERLGQSIILKQNYHVTEKHSTETSR